MSREERELAQRKKAEDPRAKRPILHNIRFSSHGIQAPVLYETDWTNEMRSVAKRVTSRTGAKVYFALGPLYDTKLKQKYHGVYLPGENAILIRADHPQLSIEDITGHEIFHLYSKMDEKLVDRVAVALCERGKTTEAELDVAIRKRYETTAYIKNFGAFSEDSKRLYYEEFIGDLHGNLNFRLGWPEKRFSAIKQIVDDEIAAWEAEWDTNAETRTKQQDMVDNENSDSIGDRVFSLTTEKTWAEQMEERNDNSSRDALYIEETPNILAEVGLGDLPLCMTKAHLNNVLHEKVEGEPHLHGVPYGVMEKLPELLSRPVMVLKSRTRRGDILVVTTAVDPDGNPIVAAIHPNGTATVDGQRGPANFITSVYGRNNLAPRSGRISKNNLLYLALKERGILYWNQKRTETLARDCGLQLPLSLGKVPSDTILGARDGYVKSQIPKRMFSFDEETEGRTLAPTLFSKLEQEIEGYKGVRIGASSAVSFLRGKGVKAEEIRWSGIETFLEGKKSVTKEELLDFLRSNRVVVTTDTKRMGKTFLGYQNTYTGEVYMDTDEVWDAAVKEAEDLGYTMDDVRIDYFGGDSQDYYVNTPDGPVTVLGVEESYSEGDSRWHDYRLDGGTNYRELLFKLPGSEYSNQAMRVHWGEEGVLAHARVQDFKTPDGEEVLFIEEIQSDWHNAGQKNGYATPDADKLQKELNQLQLKRGSREGITFEERDRIKELEGILNPEKVKLEEMTRALRDETSTNPALVRIAEELVRIGQCNSIAQARMSILSGGQLAFRMKYNADGFESARVSDADIEALRDFNRRKAECERRLNEYRSTDHNRAPEAPYAKTYHELVLKHLLRQAAEGGYDYLAWTTPQMQEERWSSEFAEGYRIEYGQDIPKFLNKYGRQWGSQVRGVRIVTDESMSNLSDIVEYEDSDVPVGAVEVPGVPVTDAMKKDVLYKGQPMFSLDEEDADDAYVPGGLYAKLFGEEKPPKVGGAIEPSAAKQSHGKWVDKASGEELYLSDDLSKYGGLLYRDEVGDYLELPDEETVDFDDLVEPDFAADMAHDYAPEVEPPDRSNDSPVAHMERAPTDTKAFRKWFNDPTGDLSNADGSPKVLLHGTPRTGFTRFDMDKTRKSRGIYLSESMSAARNYAYRGKWEAMDDDFQTPEFKPVVLDNWSQAVEFADADLGMRLTLDGNRYILSRYTDSGKWEKMASFPNTAAGLDRFNAQYGKNASASMTANPGYYAVYATMSDPLVIDAKGRDWEHVAFSGKQQRFLKTDDLVTYAFEAGYDGVIIKNVLDGDSYMGEDEFGYPSPMSRPMTEYIVKNPGQVKSVYNTGTWNRRTSDLRFSMDEDSPLASFMRQLEQEYGEGSAEDMFATMEQLDRARKRAEQRAADAEAAQQAAEWTAAAEVEAARQAERDRAEQRLSNQRDRANERAREKAAKARAEKAEAVRSARLAEQMHSGRVWSERLRKQEERAQAKQDRMKQEAKQRLNDLRSRKNQEIEDTRLAERMNAGKKVSEAKRRGEEALERERERRRQDLKLARSKDAKEAAAVIRKYHKGDVENISNAPAPTLRQARTTPGALERTRAAADRMRTWGREFYKAFVNGTLAVDDFSKLQNTDATASVLLRNAIGAGNTAQTILREHLVGKDGSTIDDQSLEDVVICWKGKGKSRKYDDASQILLQDYMLHRHNIDRMNFRDRARQAVEDFEAQHGWLTSLDPREFAELVADDNRTAQRYMELIESYQRAKNKPIFAGEDGRPLSAEYSQSMVEQYEQQYGWLKDKAESIYEWWDKFMREWVVGESLSLSEYEAMRELYPAYVPTYRKDKGGFISGVNTFGGTVSTRKGVRKATGGTSEVANIEDSYMRLLRQNVMNQRANAVLRSITDSAMLDSDGDLAGFAVFDWNEAPELFRWSAAANGVEGALEASTDTVAAKALQREGDVCRVRSWVNGEQVGAIVDPELYEALNFALNRKTGWFTKLGETLSAPMKTAITGANPAFAMRNVIRDNLTAQINSMSVVNSISGIKFEKYLAQAAIEMAQNSEHWQQFKALGGTSATYYRNEQGSLVESVQRRGQAEKNLVSKAVSGLSWMGENTEAATRFAEYLATIDRLPGGDTYTNRMIGIKNAAEVTVDFSRKGTLGKAFNAWIPYWNPGVQGIDKTFRAFFEQPSVAGKLKLLGRATLTTVLPDILLYALYKYLDRDDEWEELNDRTKDTYYCIPMAEEHTFLKIPKSRDWGQLIGTPLMRMLQGLNGREDPFENYFEVSFKPNFLWSTPLDALGISWARELEANKDFADRAIVPYPYSEMAKGDQWNSDTSKYAKVISDLGNALAEEDWLSPMQLDYIISDYFGDFGSMFQRLFAIGGNDAGATVEEQVKLAAEDLFGGWMADNRYSSATVNEYYKMLDSVSQELSAERVQNPEGYKDSVLYKLNTAFNASGSPVDRISNLNAQVRELPDGEEKNNLKQQIVELAREALQMYDAVMSGGVTEPRMEMSYSKYGNRVKDALIELADYSEDYAFLPSSYKPSSYTDPKNKNREYVLDEAAQEKYQELYDEEYASVMDETIRSSKYRNASAEKRAALLEDARDDVAPQVKKEFLKWLSKNYKSTPKKK